jgi:hypothetical protein
MCEDQFTCSSAFRRKGKERSGLRVN